MSAAKHAIQHALNVLISDPAADLLKPSIDRAQIIHYAADSASIAVGARGLLWKWRATVDEDGQYNFAVAL